MNPRLRRHLAAMTMAVSVLLLVVPSPAAAQTAAPDRPETMDDIFARVGERVPNFAGMYVNERLRTLIVLTKGAGSADGALAAALLRAELIGELDSYGRQEIRNAEYSFLELQGWYQPLVAAAFGIEGIVSTDIDEKANRLRIGVSTAGAAEAVSRSVVALGIPNEAVLINPQDPIEESSLQAKRRPVLGGQQIQFSVGGSIFNCSLGFVATRANVRGFVTNSHCTSNQGAVDGTVFHQPNISGTTNRVGFESADPAAFTGASCNPDPPNTVKCRWSDSAFVTLDNTATSSIGRIAYSALGSPSWNLSTTYRIVAEADKPPIDATVYKVGRTTGRTYGLVASTCSNAKAETSGTWYLCQVRAGYSLMKGDSGAPVFRLTPYAFDVVLVGIHWGTSGVFSPIGYVENELGPLNTCGVPAC